MTAVYICHPKRSAVGRYGGALADIRLMICWHKLLRQYWQMRLTLTIVPLKTALWAVLTKAERTTVTLHV